ncbi:MAG: GrpB family protein [Thomasclavelia sp.]|uniref:GrpB family protein n=1 Tax=Thomasclavelia sp. TaxID=3025757 RepID=UPI00399FA2A8
MTIEIVDYNENWPLEYAVEANEIRNVIINDLISIYHIGSTAIKGIKARAMIDILIVVKKTISSSELIGQLEKLDYNYDKENDNTKYYCLKKKNDSFCLYVFYEDQVTEIEKYLAVSLYLKEHHELAAKYVSIKERSANKYINKKYYQEKEKFFSEIEMDACLWYRSKNIHVA